MRLIITKTVEGKYKAHFDGSPNFFGMGDTKEEALRDLRDKTYAVLEAYAKLVQDE